MIEKLKDIAKYLIANGHQATSVLDLPYLKQNLQCEWPPIFILGPPRSGTTLLHQLMIHAFKFAYLPNIANTFYMCPIFATNLGKKFCTGYKSDFTSHYGFEKGSMAPSEAGNIWNRWFPQEKREGYNYTPAGYLPPEAKQNIYQIITNIENTFNIPFLTKNAKMSVRLPALYEIFPNALFIQIKRNLIDAAVSILILRRKYNMKWWSVMPKEINDFKNLSEMEQVCKQPFFIEQNIEEDIRLYLPDQQYIVTYNELCENPVKELGKIQHFLENHGCMVKRKENKVPITFHKSKPAAEGWVSQKEIELIKDILIRLQSSIKT